MEKKECEECFADLSKKGNDLFSSIEEKHDIFLTKMESRHNQLTVINMSILGMFALAIAYIFTIQQKKANASDVISTETLQSIMKISDNYKDQRYVLRPDQKFDESSYQITIETILERNSRGLKTIILPENS